ncbi:uncharacterized protein [Diadema antillarum]|uniref:uncharacterized protein n=1 Tax=Diadema antillarum TaxID=105358 RepID=UPI003A86F192
MEDDTLTLEKATVLAVNVESAMQDSKTLAHFSSGVPSADRVQAINRPPDKRPFQKGKAHARSTSKCVNWGGAHALKNREACPAFGKTCHSCQKANHFSSVCRNSRRNGKNVRHINDETDNEHHQNSSSHTQHVNAVHGHVGGHFKECTIDLDGTPVSLLVDVGAKVSILNEATYRRNFAEFPLQSTHERLQSYDKSTIEVLGMVSLPVRYKDTAIDHFPFYVTRGCSLMGVNLFDRLGFKLHDSTGTRINAVTTGDYQQRFPAVFSDFGEVRGYCHAPSISPCALYPNRCDDCHLRYGQNFPRNFSDWKQTES